MKAYKAFDKDLMCRDFQFEIGKTYKHTGAIEMCASGFHACEKLSNCFDYYEFSTNTRIAEVKISGRIKHQKDGGKLVCSIIKIIRELTWDEILKLANSGYRNSGHYNSGDQNSGSWNSGDQNSGSWNSGDQNSGNYNSGDRNSGILNTNEPDKIRVFNKFITKKKYDSIIFPDFFHFDLVKWVTHDTATEEEKEKYKKDIENCGGFLKNLNYKEAFQLSWDKASQHDKDLIKKIPGFDKDLFFEISGIWV